MGKISNIFPNRGGGNEFAALVPDVHRTGFFGPQKKPVCVFGHNFILRLSFDFKSVL